MLTTILFGLVCFSAAWVLRPVYTKWRRVRGFRFIASNVTSFGSGMSAVKNFGESNGPSWELAHEFMTALLPRLIELAKTKADIYWIENTCFAPLYHPENTRIMDFFRKRQKELPDGPRSDEVVPATRVNRLDAPRTGSLLKN